MSSRGGRVGEDAPAGEDDDAVANALDDLEHVRDVEDGLALRGEQDEEVLEKTSRDRRPGRKAARRKR